MYSLCVVVLSIMLYVFYLKKLKVYNPVVLLTFLWECLIVFHWMSRKVLFPVSDRALAYILLGIVCFDFGCFINGKVKIKIGKRNLTINKQENYTVRDGLVMLLLLLGIIAMITPARKAWEYISNGATLYQIRYALLDKIFYNDTINIIVTYIISPLSYLILPISVYKLLHRERFGIFIFALSCVLLVMQVITKAGRVMLLYLLCSVAVIFIISYASGLIEKKDVWKFIALFGLVFAALVILSNSREASFIKNMREYSVDSITFFSLKLDDFNFNYAHGGFSWFGILGPVYNVIDWVFGIDYSLNVNELIQYIDAATVIDRSGGIFNFFATAFFRFYGDGGIFCIIFFSMIWGFICNYYYKKLLAFPNIRTIFCYNLIVYSIVISVMTFAFADFGFFATLILINIITKKED